MQRTSPTAGNSNCRQHWLQLFYMRAAYLSHCRELKPSLPDRAPTISPKCSVPLPLPGTQNEDGPEQVPKGERAAYLSHCQELKRSALTLCQSTLFFGMFSRISHFVLRWRTNFYRCLIIQQVPGRIQVSIDLASSWTCQDQRSPWSRKPDAMFGAVCG